MFTLQPGHLTRSIPVSHPPLPFHAVSYSDASSDFGLGGVLCAPHLRRVYFFRVRVPEAEPIDRLEVEAAAVADGVFGPLVATWNVPAEVSFIDSNAGLPWITSRCSHGEDVDPILTGFWTQMAFLGPSNGLSKCPVRPIWPMHPLGVARLMSRVDGASRGCWMFSAGASAATGWGLADPNGSGRAMFNWGYTGCTRTFGRVEVGWVPATQG